MNPNVALNQLISFENLKSFSKRIIKQPLYQCWDYPENMGIGIGIIDEEPELDMEGLNDYEKLSLYIYSHSNYDICPNKKRVQKFFGWSKYRIAKMCKEIKPIEVVPVFYENTGLFCGKGYAFDYEWAERILQDS